MVEKVRKRRGEKGASAASARHTIKMAARHAWTAPGPLSTRAAGPKGLRARGIAILGAATAAGYLRGEKTERIGGRVTRKLLSAARAKSGLTSQTELLEYALSMVAVEDDYAATLLSMKGSIPDDVEL